MPKFYKKKDFDDYKEANNKLILLYLLDKMEIPLTSSQISQFALEENYMNYFSLRHCLSEMVSVNYLELTQDNNITRYSITDEGLVALDYFEKHIPIQVRNKINNYVIQNRKKVKRDYEINANYFYDHNIKEFIVKCGIYENSISLMEISLSVVSKEQARQIVANWKSNVNFLYQDILKLLADEKENN